MSNITPEQQELQSQLEQLSEHVNKSIVELRTVYFGKIATILDATVTDQAQLKSLKDLVSDAIYSPSYWNSIRRQFDLIAEANGIKLFDYELKQLAEPTNPYKK